MLNSDVKDCLFAFACLLAVAVLFLTSTRRGKMLCGYAHIATRRLRRSAYAPASRYVHFATPLSKEEESRCVEDSEDSEEEDLPPEVVSRSYKKTHKD